MKGIEQLIERIKEIWKYLNQGIDMKALILAGGRGKRLGIVAQESNKCLIEVHNKPLIEYSLNIAAGLDEIDEIVIIVGYRAEDIINKYGNKYRNKNIQYILQLEQKGLVHAIGCASEALGSYDFMLMLGDEFMVNPHHKEFIEEFYRQNIFALCGVALVNNMDLIKKTYAVIQSDKNRISQLIEKPNKSFNNVMGTGNILFKNQILQYIARTQINQKRKEKELTDLIQCAIDEGHIVKSFVICKEYINVNCQEELNRIKTACKVL